MNQEVKADEQIPFKDMFDCLQEGIIVIEKDFRLSFANNLAKRILDQAFNTTLTPFSEPYQEFDSNNFDTQIFYEYKNMKQQDEPEAAVNGEE